VNNPVLSTFLGKETVGRLAGLIVIKPALPDLAGKRYQAELGNEKQAYQNSIIFSRYHAPA